MFPAALISLSPRAVGPAGRGPSARHRGRRGPPAGCTRDGDRPWTDAARPRTGRPDRRGARPRPPTFPHAARCPPDLRTLHQIGGREADVLLPRPVEPRQGGALHPRGELHRVVLVEGLRQGRHHHLGDAADRLPVGRPGPARSTSRAAARAGRRSPGTPTRRPGCATRTCAACCWRCTARPRRAGGDPVLAWAEIVDRPERSKPLQAGARQGRPRARQLGRGHRDRSPPRTCTRSSATARTGSPGSRRSRRCRWSRTPSGARFYRLIGGVDAVVLRLVRRPAGRLAAGVRRPDRRAGVRRLVGRRLPDDVGLQRAGHPHPGRALDGRGPLPRARRSSWSRRTTPTTPSSPTSGCPPRRAPTARWRWRWVT